MNDKQGYRPPATGDNDDGGLHYSAGQHPTETRSDNGVEGGPHSVTSRRRTPDVEVTLGFSDGFYIVSDKETWAGWDSVYWKYVQAKKGPVRRLKTDEGVCARTFIRFQAAHKLAKKPDTNAVAIQQIFDSANIVVSQRSIRRAKAKLGFCT